MKVDEPYEVTLAKTEALVQRHPAVGYYNGRHFESIGRTLQRMINREPPPLSDLFAKRLMLAIVEDPVPWGKLFVHAIRAVQEAQEETDGS